MSDKIHIAVDAMGGDLGPRLCVSASQKFLLAHPDVNITLVGDRQLIEHSIQHGLPHIDIQHAETVVDMAERPSTALRYKHNSSMAEAINLVAENRAHACVSAGNTGALMAFGLRLLGTLDGIHRPAICKALPSEHGHCWVLDLGASLDCSAEQLLQFGEMAWILVNSGSAKIPRVGLLNVGVEAQKGRDLQRQAAELFEREFASAYVGFVEAGDIYRGGVDIVVCDGFSGNVLLKASEGATEFLQKSLDNSFNKSVFTRLLGKLAQPVMQSWRREYNLARFNGALFLGLTKVLVKSHGAASEEGFMASIAVAYEQVCAGTIAHIQSGFHI